MLKALGPGLPHPLGATPGASGVNFAVYSEHATGIELCLYAAAGGPEVARYALPARTGNVWHGFAPSAIAMCGTPYAYAVDGPAGPHDGHCFNARAALIDPYARRLSTTTPLRTIVVEDGFDWQGDALPGIAWRNTVIYELHVKGYTKLHPDVPEQLRGTYLGLASEPVIRHLKSIGVTAVELLPCQAFVSEPFLKERNLTNYWGYNSVAWFAPANEYAVHDAVSEFKEMVRALHAAGIEVILDVVFNHTAEGDEIGPLYSLKGIDNSVYYRLLPDRIHYENSTGCGNTVNCEHPQVRNLVIDCLKYWVECMHVDGFRFDLATVLAREGGGFNEHSAFFSALRQEPALAKIKMIAEPWDIGWGGYQLGKFAAGWSEWNDRYRDTVRAFWRRDPGKTGEFAERIAGSGDVFRHNGRKPTASVNFITAHDGFTMKDLVSYNERHNEANLERNADGTGNNLSWNCGVEGTTEDAAVIALRKRQMRNLLATLFLSQGVPMLQAGDEFARTQSGNNNAYCQDNEISWVDWRRCAENQELVQFVRLLSALRSENPEFRRETFFKGTASRTGVKDVSWLHFHGGELTSEQWQEGQLRTLGVLYGNRNNSSGRLLLLFNADPDERAFSLPQAPAGSPWFCRFDTARGTLDPVTVNAAEPYLLAPSSAVLLEC